MKLLLAWLGNADLKASVSDGGDGVGPIAQAVAAKPFDRIVLLANQPRSGVDMKILEVPVRILRNGPEPFLIHSGQAII